MKVAIRKLQHITPLILTAHDLAQESRDGAYKLLQEANFFWLTSIAEAGWMLVVDGKTSRLVMPERTKVQRIFEGGLSADEAKALSGVDAVISSAEGMELLSTLAKRHEYIYTLGPDPMASSYDFTLNPAPARLRHRLEKTFHEVRDCRLELSVQRAIKRPDEIALMQAAIDVTAVAFRRAKAALEEARVVHEYELEAEMTHAIRSAGASGHAYEPIVASGANALTLHYDSNNDVLPKDGLVLIDVGARVDGYAADITRTYAIGVPTAREKQVHAAVEKAHHAIIALIKPGLSVVDYHDSVDEIMKDALQELGLLHDRSDTKTYRTYFPHAVSHGVGIDVHESLGGAKVFKPGMTLTVEPGIYISEEGIGVRIEDDILVTETGAINLSAGLPTSL